MLFYSKIPIVYYALNIAYYAISTIFPDIPIIGPVCWLSAMLISLGTFFYELFCVKKNLCIQALMILVIFLTIYGFLLILNGDVIVWSQNRRVVDNKSYLLNLWSAFLPIISTYAFWKRGWLHEKLLKILFVLSLILSSCIFFDYYQKKLFLASLINSSQVEFTNETSYLFLALFPLVVLFDKNKLLQYFFLLYIFFFQVLSFKRGVLLIGILCLAYFFKYSTEKLSLRRKFYSFIGVFFVITILGVFCYTEYQSSLYFQTRIESTQRGNTSGRTDIYDDLFSHFLNDATSAEFLLGNGANGTLKITETYAHNDWLAILTEQGLLGILIYTLYWIAFLYAWLTVREKKCRFVIGACFIESLGKSIFSMYYLPISPNMQFSSFLSAVVMGCYLAESDSQKLMYLENKQFLIN